MENNGTVATGKVYAAMIKVMRSVGAIGKDQKNQAPGANYKFRGIDDVYNKIHDDLAEAGLVTVPRTLERTETSYKSKSGTDMLRVVLKTEYDFLADDGSKQTIGPIYSEGNDSSDKSTNKALSAAHKYALLQVFCIATAEDKDADFESPENPPAKKQSAKNEHGKSAEKKKFEQVPGCITEKQLNRLFAIRAQREQETGYWTQAEVKDFIQAKIGKESSKFLTKKEYDDLISLIENSTPEEAYR